MSNSKLPARASLEYLKKLAKDRLPELRRADPQARLATAQLAVAREYGFTSWRALKTEFDQRRQTNVASFFDACVKGDIEALRDLLTADPSLVRVMAGPRYQRTGLHAAAQAGHVEAVRLLLELGADPNARETGDNTYPLHWAAAGGHVDTVRALLDAGGDVHGVGDAHEFDVIGWATFDHAPSPEVIDLLVERGARHHIFSTIAMGDLSLIRQVVEQNPAALARRMSRFEQGQTALHYAMNLRRYDILALLIELGADLEAPDRNGQTALAAAMLKGDRDAMRLLQTAGAKQPAAAPPVAFKPAMAKLAASVSKGVPMISVPDIAAALAWYTSIGFKELNRFEEDGVVNFGMVALGKAELMFAMHGKPGPPNVTLWFYTDKVDDLYELLKSRQMAGGPVEDEIPFEQDIHDAFYGAREFAIRDPNGYTLYFIHPTT